LENYSKSLRASIAKICLLPFLIYIKDIAVGRIATFLMMLLKGAIVELLKKINSYKP